MKKEERNIYIANEDPKIALEKYINKLNIFSTGEEIPLANALGRISFEPIFAIASSPSYHACAMDGIAVRVEATLQACEKKPLVLKEDRDFVYVNTGNPLVPPFDGVIMIEEILEERKGEVVITQPCKYFQHVRPIGEDIVASEMIIPSGKIINPFDLAALAQGGIKQIKVVKKPIIGIIPTGNEIVQYSEDIPKGKIVDSNSLLFSGLIQEYGGEAKVFPIVEDDFETLVNKVEEVSKLVDILIINAGSSAGTKDYTSKVIGKLGEVVVHGVALKPGKPSILGIVNNKSVIGLPGYPVSSYVAFEAFVKPVLQLYQGKPVVKDNTVEAVLTRRLVSSLKHKEMVRVQLGEINGKTVATPLQRGAGITMSLVKAHGMLEIPRNIEGIEAGEKVKVSLFKSDYRENLISIGSHDIIMDLISEKIPATSAHTGSLGGLMALKKGECHIAPIHLLDEATGIYNQSFIDKYLDKGILIKGVKRIQGLMVKAGNPKNIVGIEDLERENITFVNRQRGSGTRVLLDYYLKQHNIDGYKIKGYDLEMNTHLAVACEIKEGRGDTGLGTYWAAKTMGLDFIEVGFEEYDFATTEANFKDERVKKFIDILDSEEFRSKLLKIGGYTVYDR